MHITTRSLIAFFTSVLMISSSVKGVLAASVVPEFVDGNPTCQDLGYTYGFKPGTSNGVPEDNPEGTFNLPGDDTNTVTIDPNATGLDAWSSTLSMDAVIIKGGPNANVYRYNPESTSDSSLSTPINTSNDDLYGLSHVEFCYDYDVQVSKTAEPYFSRTWDWTIQKTGDISNATLSIGQNQLINYTVTVNSTHQDSDYGVSGEVAIYNPDPNNPSIISTIVDTITENIPADLDCEVSFPYELGPKNTLTCTYNESLPDGSDRTNHAVVTTTEASKVGGGGTSKAFTFVDPTTKIDECADITDDKKDYLGELCGTTTNHEYEYTQEISYDTCGEYTYSNVASYMTSNRQLTGSDAWDVEISIPCGAGYCSYSQGYWFAKPNVAWNPNPIVLSTGLQIDKSFWKPNFKGPMTPGRMAGQQYAAVYLSFQLNEWGKNYPEAIKESMKYIDTNLYYVNLDAKKAPMLGMHAEILSKWIDQNHCQD
jgi:hypothetical protein